MSTKQNKDVLLIASKKNGLEVSAENAKLITCPGKRMQSKVTFERQKTYILKSVAELQLLENDSKRFHA
jgi:hypothetical protein